MAYVLAGTGEAWQEGGWLVQLAFHREHQSFTVNHGQVLLFELCLSKSYTTINLVSLKDATGFLSVLEYITNGLKLLIFRTHPSPCLSPNSEGLNTTETNAVPSFPFTCSNNTPF